MKFQPGQQTIAIHILTNISRCKGNQILKFGHLIKYKIRKNFLETSCTKCYWENTPRPFSENLKLSISLDQ